MGRPAVVRATAGPARDVALPAGGTDRGGAPRRGPRGCARSRPVTTARSVRGGTAGTSRPFGALGGVTHLVWDGLAHRPGAPGWANNLLPFLHQPSIAVGGGGATASDLQRRRRPSRSPVPPDRSAAAGPGMGRPGAGRRLRPGLFWSIAITALAARAASWPIQNYKTTYPCRAFAHSGRSASAC